MSKVKFLDKTGFGSNGFKTAGGKVWALGIFNPYTAKGLEINSKYDFGRLHSVKPNEDLSEFDFSGLGYLQVPASEFILLYGMN